MKSMILSILLSAVVLYGCSTLEIADPEEMVKHPLGTESIRLGMSKTQVESIWGKPDDVRTVEGNEKKQGPREVWTYRAQYSAIPVDAGYLSKTKKLYFDGENLTEIGE
ncbi:MAG: hypothetical protein PHT32_03105 [Candidatus Omnitrophica bacterium]|nr:hypothetical protein [Candidatus Omnitrophota bacterium]